MGFRYLKNTLFFFSKFWHLKNVQINLSNQIMKTRRLLVEMIFISTWNPNDPCFYWKGPCFGGLKPKNRGQRGSRYFLRALSHWSWNVDSETKIIYQVIQISHLFGMVKWPPTFGDNKKVTKNHLVQTFWTTTVLILFSSDSVHFVPLHHGVAANRAKPTVLIACRARTSPGLHCGW